MDPLEPRRARALLRRAVDRADGSFASRVFRAGPHKFLLRALARTTPSGLVRRARLFDGDRLHVILPEIVSETIYTYGFHDPLHTSVVLDLVQPGDPVLDAGAHVGYFTRIFARLAHGTGRVHAFEPTPRLGSLLAKNTTELERASVHRVAVGDEDGSAEMEVYPVRLGAFNTLTEEPRFPEGEKPKAVEHIETPMVRVDTVVQDEGLAPDFLKIDVENHEPAVLRGARKTLERHRPTVMVEAGDPDTLQAVRDLMDLGYDAAIAGDDGRLVRWDRSLEEANALRGSLFLVDPDRYDAHLDPPERHARPATNATPSGTTGR